MSPERLGLKFRKTDWMTGNSGTLPSRSALLETASATPVPPSHNALISQ